MRDETISLKEIHIGKDFRFSAWRYVIYIDMLEGAETGPPYVILQQAFNAS